MKGLKYFYLVLKSILFIFCLLFLTQHFNSNKWDICYQEKFENFQIDTEAWIIGRLIKSNNDGVLSSGGLTGKYQTKDSDITKYQYDIYLDSIPYDKEDFETYNTQIGGQGILFSILNQTLTFSNQKKFDTFQLITSFLTALIFSLFLFWVFANFGFVTTLITLLLLAYSDWVTFFGRNLWWSLWSFYIPFITLLLCFHFKKIKSQKRLYLISTIVVFIKCFFTGYEYITTTLVMFIIPIIFYSIKSHWDLRFVFKNLFSASIGAISGIVISMLLLILQISAISGSVTNGFNHIEMSFNKRTSGAEDGLHEAYNISLESNIFEVLEPYWNSYAFNFNSYIEEPVWESFLIIDFGELILLSIIFSLFILLVNQSNKKITFALSVTTWISFLAPISWFVIFKGHSYIHTHMNFIIWYMPFALFGFICFGYSFSLFLKYLFKSISKKALGESSFYNLTSFLNL